VYSSIMQAKSWYGPGALAKCSHPVVRRSEQPGCDGLSTTLDRTLQQLTALKALRSAAKACQPRLVANSHVSLLSCGLRALVGVAKRLDRQLYASEMA
jgi:hypothetical protein